MKPIVIDTSVAVKWFFPENGQDKALELKEKHVAGEVVLSTRDLFLYELTSAFKNYTPVKIYEKDFSVATLAVQSLNLSFYHLEFAEMKELFLLSQKLVLSIYDCSFVLLAKKLSAPLYTADKKLYQKAHTFISTRLL